MGKKVIVTGRRENRLLALEKELPGLETYAMDNTDIAALPEHVSSLLGAFPDLNTVWINSGIQYAYSLKEKSISSDDHIIEEITTNVTAPVLFARHFIPHLASLRTEANFLVTSSGLAFIPMGTYPVYCPTKSFIHHFMISLRQQLKGTSVNVIEIAPPYVETDLDAAHRTTRGPPPMPLAEYTEKTFRILDTEQAKNLKEVAVGFAAMGAEAWRNSMGTILERMQLGG